MLVEPSECQQHSERPICGTRGLRRSGLLSRWERAHCVRLGAPTNWERAHFARLGEPRVWERAHFARLVAPTFEKR